jgi:hypothetical protein
MDDKIREKNLDKLCSTRRIDEKYVQYFGRKKLKGRYHLEVIGVAGKIILKWLLQM